MSIGASIRETLVLGANKNEIRGLVARAGWLKNYITKAQIIGESELSAVLPQAMAAHLILIDDKNAPSHTLMGSLTSSYRHHTNNLGVMFEDKLQRSLFAIAMYHNPAEVKDATRRAAEHERRLGAEPHNFKNWMFVQDFLFVDMQDTMKVRPIIKMIYTIIELMSAIADDFPDDLSPRHEITG